MASSHIKQTYRLCGIFATAIVSLFAVYSAKAFAAAQDITITPTVVNQAIAAGSTYTGSFQVVNQGKTGYQFHVYATTYHVNGEDYQPGFTYIPGSPKVDSWFSFGIGQTNLNPGDAATVPYAIKIPAGTPPGGYYGVAFAETNYPSTANGVTLNERRFFG